MSREPREGCVGASKNGVNTETTAALYVSLDGLTDTFALCLEARCHITTQVTGRLAAMRVKRAGRRKSPARHRLAERLECANYSTSRPVVDAEIRNRRTRKVL
jgi:hypothetical protein